MLPDASPCARLQARRPDRVSGVPDMPRMGVAGRLGLALALVLAFAFGLLGFLAYEKHRKAFAGIVQARVGAITLDLAAAADSGLNLGLPLAAMSNLGELFQREAQRDSEILSVDAFDPAGRILHSSDPARVGEAVPQPWSAAAAGSRRWRVEEPDAFVSGVSVRNSYDAAEGALAVRFDRRPFDSALAGTAEALAWRTALVFAACAVAVAVGARLLLRGEAR